MHDHTCHQISSQVDNTVARLQDARLRQSWHRPKECAAPCRGRRYALVVNMGTRQLRALVFFTCSSPVGCRQRAVSVLGTQHSASDDGTTPSCVAARNAAGKPADSNCRRTQQPDGPPSPTPVSDSWHRSPRRSSAPGLSRVQNEMARNPTKTDEGNSAARYRGCVPQKLAGRAFNRS